MLQSYQERERLAREAVRKIAEKQARLFTKEGSREFYRAPMETESIDRLFDLARDGDKDALEIFKKRTRDPWDQAHKLGLNVVHIPTRVTQLALEIFFDGPPKAKPGLSPKDLGLRNAIIDRLVKMISRDYGFPEYTPPEHRDDPDVPLSAC